MSITYEVRTPFGADGESFHKAMARIKRQSEIQLEIRPKWLRGRDKNSGRFHFWQIDDREAALMFLLTFGDQVKEKEKGDTNVGRIEESVHE